MSRTNFDCAIIRMECDTEKDPRLTGGLVKTDKMPRMGLVAG